MADPRRDDTELGPGQQEIVDLLSAHTTAEIDRLAGVVEAATAETIAAGDANTDDILGELDLIDETTHATETALAAHTTQTAADHADLTARLDVIDGKLDALAKPDEPDPPPPWSQQPDLIDANFRPVIGFHTGGESQKSDRRQIWLATGRSVQLATIYQKNRSSPYDAALGMLYENTVPRIECCLPHVFTSTGARMPTSGDSFWKRSGLGEYDDLWVPLFREIGRLDRPVIVSPSHEADLRGEDGASPKNPKPPASSHCGPWTDYPGFHAHAADLIRQHAPKARIFLNLSGGYRDEGLDSGAVGGRWDKMRPPDGTFDWFGWDLYNMKYRMPGSPWQSFESRLKMWQRWDWYKRNVPDVPIFIGETGTCAGQEPGEDAGEWLLAMVEFVVANRWQGVGTGGGIDKVCYFSHHYDAHPRCVDDAGTHSKCGSGQHARALPLIGADKRLAWA